MNLDDYRRKIKEDVDAFCLFWQKEGADVWPVEMSTEAWDEQFMSFLRP